MKQEQPIVPAFVSKLWMLVEDPFTNEFITWSQNGESFMVLDERRFAKEILPLHFKHNNMTSFVRQLNMYGFRKVVHIDTGAVKVEHDEPIEFHHSLFRHGHENMLIHIKRKVASTKVEEKKVTQEDISQILNNAHRVQANQEIFESRLSALQRENESLWREVGELRAKHSQQQQVIQKLVQFIVTLVQSNRLANLKRKRTLLLNTNGPSTPTVLPQIVKEPDDDTNSGPIQKTKGLKQRGHLTDDIIIYDVTDDLLDESGADDSLSLQPTFESSDNVSSDISRVQGTMPEIVLVEDDDEYDDGPVIQGDQDFQSEDIISQVSNKTSPLLPTSSPQSSRLSCLTSEDPVTMMDSLLNGSGTESGTVSQSMNHLGKAELMDYLDKMDCSLEDFQAMLSGKQFSIDPELLVDLFTSSVQMNPAEINNNPKPDTKSIDSSESNSLHPAAVDAESSSQKLEKQLVQYTKYPVLTDLLEQCTDTESQPIVDAAPKQSKLVRLEPLTEEQASEATLFYLCKLERSPLDIDTPILDD